ncbi:histidine--tRNA ligase [Tepidiforma sp.]|jgi:histidyl-tRNA synthetase|uniref:histidine--tRNA ligase n=1 Tax=Tepidiforma sp. TaxID=2682230 RepID=UPI00263452C5|nr:histidine--tRNA ligase [Tepidiforma sp.]MCX7617146.1 histidine--tRNA ligase [Tepidiforma sp.]
MPRFQAPRGTQDVLPAMQPYWQAVLDAVREVARLHGFQRVDTPMFEDAGVFEKGSGDTTDIVEKEMYVFEDRGGDRLALTPEGTPAIVRAYLEHGMGSWPQPVRLYTTHPMFRYDRPQKGRYRQHTQFDAEVLGSADPLVDAEVITMLWRLYGMLGIRGITVRLGSLDDLEPRRAYVERLKEYYRPFLGRLSEDSQRRFERNPLRLLDSKDERDLPYKEAAPKLVDQLSPAAREHHEAVQAALAAAGVRFAVDPLLVRGLDYYNRTVFEVVPDDDERAQGTIGGGGRYDGLVELLGGPPTPGIGFGTGIERIILEMQKNGVVFEPAPAAEAFIVHRGEGSGPAAVRLAAALRDRGIAAVIGEGGRSFKAQLRSANAAGARLALIIGEDELAKGVALLKPLEGEGEQAAVPLEQAAEAAEARLRAG